MLTYDEIQKQSLAAWNQWKKQWIKQCKINKQYNNNSFDELLYIGKEKTLLQVAFGNSLSRSLETIRKFRNRYDIYCCDKVFGYLMQNNIVPNYCHVADANVSTDWIKGQDTSNTILIANIACNPDWPAKWKGKIYFYVNWDNIGTAHILGQAGNCYNAVPAASNVSNAQVVFASQVFAYAKQLLIGFDYSWAISDDEGLYYADHDSDKKYWMHHATVVTAYGKLAKTSSNLIFSCKWLLQYLQKFVNQTIINCSEEGIFDCEYKMPLVKAIGG